MVSGVEQRSHPGAPAMTSDELVKVDGSDRAVCRRSSRKTADLSTMSGWSCSASALVSPHGQPAAVLIGAMVLEELDILVDCGTQTLYPRARFDTDDERSSQFLALAASTTEFIESSLTTSFTYAEAAGLKVLTYSSIVNVPPLAVAQPAYQRQTAPAAANGIQSIHDVADHDPPPQRLQRLAGRATTDDYLAGMLMER